MLAAGIFRVVRKPKPRRDSVESPEQRELPEGAHARFAAARRSARAAAHIDLSAAAQQLSEGDREQLADRIRQVAKRDPAATANVLRMWLQDGQS